MGRLQSVDLTAPAEIGLRVHDIVVCEPPIPAAIPRLTLASPKNSPEGRSFRAESVSRLTFSAGDYVSVFSHPDPTLRAELYFQVSAAAR